MATYTAARSKHAALVANTADTVTLTPEFGMVEVRNRDTTASEIYVRTDGTAPTVGGDDSYVVPNGQVVVLPAPTAQTVVKLISATAAKYTVAGG